MTSRLGHTFDHFAFDHPQDVGRDPHVELDAAIGYRQDVVFEELPALRGEGGVIAIDHRGEIAMEFNSEGMFRASRRAGEEARVAIYRP